MIDDLGEIVAFLFGGAFYGEDAAPMNAAGGLGEGFDADEGLIVPQGEAALDELGDLVTELAGVVVEIDEAFDDVTTAGGLGEAELADDPAFG